MEDEVKIIEQSIKHQSNNYINVNRRQDDKQIEKKSAPETYTHFWVGNSRHQMAVGRGVGGKVNLPPRGNSTQKFILPA